MTVEGDNPSILVRPFGDIHLLLLHVLSFWRGYSCETDPGSNPSRPRRSALAAGRRSTIKARTPAAGERTALPLRFTLIFSVPFTCRHATVWLRGGVIRQLCRLLEATCILSGGLKGLVGCRAACGTDLRRQRFLYLVDIIFVFADFFVEHRHVRQQAVPAVRIRSCAAQI